MTTVICILILVYLVKGKNIDTLLENVKNVDWKAKASEVYDKLHPYALKGGRVATKPLLQFYYVMQDEHTSTTERVMIYAAIIYTVSPVNLLPKAVYGLLGCLDEGAAVMFVYKKVKSKITPEIDAKVNATLDEWFGVEFEMAETH